MISRGKTIISKEALLAIDPPRTHQLEQAFILGSKLPSQELRKPAEELACLAPER